MTDRSDARLIIPDIHHKVGLVDRIRDNHPGIAAMFLGDYFDDFFDGPAHMEVTCRWLKRALENSRDTFLLGNHCFAYLSYELGVRWGHCAGWTVAKQQVFHQHFPGEALLKSCAWVTYRQGWVISHAGITRKLYRAFSKRNSFDGLSQWVSDAERALTVGVSHPALLAGTDRGGPARAGGILWCDWDAFEPVKGLRQIVGHTPTNDVRYKGGDVCLDTHLHHYGLLENEELTILEAK